MNQPPEDPYFRQRQKQTPHSSRKPGNYPGVPQQPQQSLWQGQGAVPNNQPQQPWWQGQGAVPNNQPQQSLWQGQGTVPNNQPQQAWWQGQGAIPNNGQQAGNYGQALRPFSPQGQKQNNASQSWEDSIVQPPKVRKLHRRLVDLITITAILALVVGGVSTYLNISSGKSPLPPASSMPLNSVIIPTPTLIIATPSTGATGQPVQAGAWLVTVLHVGIAPDVHPANRDDAYVEVRLTLKNTSPDTQILVSLLEFLLKGTSNRLLHETFTDPDIQQLPDGNVAAGQTLQAQVAFEAPASEHHYVLVFQYGLVENSTAAVDWPVTV